MNELSNIIPNNNFAGNEEEGSESIQMSGRGLTSILGDLEKKKKDEQSEQQGKSDISEAEILSSVRLKELLAFELGREGKDLLKYGLQAFFGNEYKEFDRTTANLAVLNKALSKETSSDRKQFFKSWEGWIKYWNSNRQTRGIRMKVAPLKNALEEKRPISSILSLFCDFLSNSGVGIEDVLESLKQLTGENTFLCLVLTIHFQAITDCLLSQKDLLLNIWFNVMENLNFQENTDILNVVAQIKLVQFSYLISRLQHRQSLAVSISEFVPKEEGSSLQSKIEKQVKELMNFAISNNGLLVMNYSSRVNYSANEIELLSGLIKSKEDQELNVFAKALHEIAVRETAVLSLNNSSIQFIEVLFQNGRNSSTDFSSYLNDVTSLSNQIEAKLLDCFETSANYPEIKSELSKTVGTTETFKYVVLQDKSSIESQINFLISALEKSSHVNTGLILDHLCRLVRNYFSNPSLSLIDLNPILQLLLQSTYGFLNSKTNGTYQQIQANTISKILKLIEAFGERRKRDLRINSLRALFTLEYELSSPIQLGTEMISIRTNILEIIEAFLFALVRLSMRKESEDVLGIMGELLKLLDLAFQGIHEEELNCFMTKFNPCFSRLSFSFRIRETFTNFLLKLHFDPRATEENLANMREFIQEACLVENIQKFVAKIVANQDSSKTLKLLDASYSSFIDTEEFETAFYSYIYLKEMCNFRFKEHLQQAADFFKKIALSVEVKSQDKLLVAHFPTECLTSQIYSCHKREFMEEIKESSGKTVKEELVLAGQYLENVEAGWKSQYWKAFLLKFLHLICFIPTFLGILVIALDHHKKVKKEDYMVWIFILFLLQIVFQAVLSVFCIYEKCKRDDYISKFEKLEKRKFVSLSLYIFSFMIATSFSILFNYGLEICLFVQSVGFFLSFTWFINLIVSIPKYFFVGFLAGIQASLILIVYFDSSFEDSMIIVLTLLASGMIISMLIEIIQKRSCRVCGKKYISLNKHLKENSHSLFDYICFILRVKRKKRNLKQWLELSILNSMNNRELRWLPLGDY